MKQNTGCISLALLALCLYTATQCDARKQIESIRGSAKETRKINAVKHTFLEQMMTQLNLAQPLDSSDTQPYGVSSPSTLPPYDSLPSVAFPENAPSNCVNPPNAPQTPSAISPPFDPNLTPPQGPVVMVPSPPGSSSNPNPNPPVTIPSPPEPIPGPPCPSGPVLGPPYYEPGPPYYERGPPISIPSPFSGMPSPTGFLPPIVFPPPTVPPPPHVTPSSALWCVAKPSVPDPIIQEAMNYACGSGADCSSIQPSGPCFEPNTLWAHASFAFNSFWQRTKAAGGTCDFGGTGMLVTIDPSYDGCHFDYF